MDNEKSKIEPKIESIEVRADYGKFSCEPLERGYGHTIGNSLRRMLLASLEGAAVTSIKIDGVLHEFSTLPGVREDITNIVLNIKHGVRDNAKRDSLKVIIKTFFTNRCCTLHLECLSLVE